MVESMLRQVIAASFQFIERSLTFVLIPNYIIKYWPIIISYQLRLISTTCIEWMIFLFACNSGKLKLWVLFLELVVSHQAAVFHFWIPVLEQILRPFDDYLLIIYLLASEYIKAFTIWVFIFLLSLHDGSFNLTK